MTPEQMRLRELEQLCATAEVGYEIVTPWKLDDYMTKLDSAIHALNVELVKAGSFEVTTAKGFDFLGWVQFLNNWNDFKARVDSSTSERWLSPGLTYNRAETYHNEYREWFASAKQLGFVATPDPMAPPQPAEDNDDPWPDIGPSDKTTSGLITVGLLFGVGYVISQIKR